MSREADVEVVGMEKEGPHALETIKALQPDVILMDSGNGQELACANISEIFQEAPDARLVSLSLQENGMDIYDKRRVVASEPKDLVRAIRREADDRVPRGETTGR